MNIRVTLPTQYNKNIICLALLSVGSLFIKNPKLFNIALLDVAILIIAIFGNIKIAFNGKNQALLITFCFFLFCLLGFFLLPDPVLIIKYLLRMIKSFVVCILGYNLIKNIDEEQKGRFIRFFFWIALTAILIDTVYSLVITIPKIGKVDTLYHIYSSLKLSYIFADKNMVGFTLAILMFISNKFIKNKFLLFLWFISLVTLSRSAILINTLFLVYYMREKIFNIKVIAYFGLLITAGLIILYLLDFKDFFIERITFKNDASLATRFELQAIGLRMWKESPFLGQGLSGFEQRFFEYYRTGEQNPYPHNFYIYALSEFGLAGLFLIACFFVVIYSKLSLMGLRAYLVIYLSFGMFLLNFVEYQYFFLLGILLGFRHLRSSHKVSIAEVK